MEADTVPNLEDYVPPEFAPNVGAPEWLNAVDAGLLVLLLGLAAWAVTCRRSLWWLWSAQAVALLWFGFVRAGCLCPVGSVGNVSVALLHPDTVLGVMPIFYFVLPLAACLLRGRVFCGGVCPLGTVQDLLGFRARRTKSLVSARVERWLGLGAWAFLGFAIFAAWQWRELPICQYDPFVPVFHLAASWPAWILSGVVLAACAFVSRPYCRWLCPYGALLGLLSRAAWRRRTIAPSCVKCRKCEKSCPMNCIEKGVIRESSCILCGRCTKVCRKDAVQDR